MFKVITLLLVGIRFSFGQKADVVDLVYAFGARCPFSLEFLIDEFYSGYHEIGDYVNLTLLIFTKVDDKGEIHCQHGDNECFISKAQVCTFNSSGLSQSQQVEFVHCSALNARDEANVTSKDVEECLSNILPEVSWKEVESCMNNEKSNILLKEQYFKAKSYGVDYVPSLIFFGKHDVELENSARVDFVSTVCSLLSNPPAACNENKP